MNRFAAAVSGVALMALPAIAQAQQTITFDDLSQNDCMPFTYLPEGYQGFDWWGFYAARAFDYESRCGDRSLFQNGVVSPLNVAFTTPQSEVYGRALMSSLNPFTFNSVYVTSAVFDQSVTLIAYLGASLMYTETFDIVTSGPSLKIFDWTNVDRVWFQAGAPMVLDNMVVNGPTSPTNVVPEPGTLLLLGTGLVGIGGRFLRRRKSAEQ